MMLKTFYSKLEHTLQYSQKSFVAYCPTICRMSLLCLMRFSRHTADDEDFQTLSDDMETERHNKKKMRWQCNDVSNRKFNKNMYIQLLPTCNARTNAMIEAILFSFGLTNKPPTASGLLLQSVVSTQQKHLMSPKQLLTSLFDGAAKEEKISTSHLVSKIQIVCQLHDKFATRRKI